MSIVRALPKDVSLIHRLIQQGRHVYTNFGQEDLAYFLRKGLTVLGIDDGAVWGFLCIEEETRPETLPSPLFSRAYLRSVVLGRGASPALDVNRLLNAAFPAAATDRPIQLIYYATQSWLLKPLQIAGFEVVERVEYLRLDYLSRHAEMQVAPPKAPLRLAEIALRPLLPAEAAQLAQLDVETFTPLWHLGAKHLQELAITGRVQIAVRKDTATAGENELNAQNLLGYSALVLSGAGEAQLARLAVHPHVQGYGLGRYLLTDAIRYAQHCRASAIVLNTQTTNQASKALYQSVGFRSTGQITPVLVKKYQ